MKKAIIFMIYIVMMIILSSCSIHKYDFVYINFINYFDTDGYIAVEYDSFNEKYYDIVDKVSKPLFTLLKDLENTFAGDASSIEYSLTKEINNCKDSIIVNEDIINILDIAFNISNKYPQFDVTSGSLTYIWKSISNSAYIDLETGLQKYFKEIDDTEIQTAKTTVGYQNIQIDKETKTLTKLNTNTRFDFGAIAKGYATDKIRLLLRELGFDFFLINFGGNIYTEGKSKVFEQYEDDFGIYIDSLESETVLFIKEENIAISTSSALSRSFTIDGHKYSHIINLETGYPVDNNIKSVSIINESSTISDAYSTLVLVSGLEDGFNILKDNSINGIIVTNDKKIYINGDLNYELIDSSYEVFKEIGD